MKKYLEKKLVYACLFLTVIAALETPFGTWTYSQIFAMISAGDKQRVIAEILFIILATAFLVLAQYLYARSINQIIFSFNENVRTYLLKSTFSTEDENISAKLSFVNNDLEMIERNYISQIFSFISSVVSLVVCLLLAINANFILTLIFMAFSSLSVIAPKIMAKKVQESSKIWSDKVSKYTGFMNDYLKHINLILHYNAFPFLFEKGKKVVYESANAKKKRDNTIALSNFIAGILAYALSFLPIGIGIWFVIDKRLSLSSFIMVQYSSAWIVNNILAINGSLTTINSAKPLLKHFDQLQILSEKTRSGENEQVEFSALNVEHISFAFDEHQVVKDVNLVINKGDKILITGRSGQGKSTLLHLLTNALKPDSGKAFFVTASGKKILTKPEYFGEVDQNSNIFNDTFRFNLTLGREFSDEEINVALNKAGLTELGQRVGLDGQINEDGNNLSGGEKKRIELARAFLYNRNFLLIDEGTASLDPKTAEDIHNLLLDDSNLTVIEIDHHVPDDIRKKFSKCYELKDNNLLLV